MKGNTMIAFALILAFSAQPAGATSDVVEQEVRLAFPAGADAQDMYHQVKVEARKACRSRAVYPHQQLSATAACRRQFIDDAIVALDRPALTALHRQSTGEDVTRLADAE